MLDLLSMRTNLLIYKYGQKLSYDVYMKYAFSICSVILQVLYGLTMVPGEGDTVYVDFSAQYTHVSLLRCFVFVLFNFCDWVW